jgi:hypothetical protein
MREDISEYSKPSMPLSASSTSSQTAYMTGFTSKDPYNYQVGFGNHLVSEAM